MSPKLRNGSRTFPLPLTASFVETIRQMAAAAAPPRVDRDAYAEGFVQGVIFGREGYDRYSRAGKTSRGGGFRDPEVVERAVAKSVATRKAQAAKRKADREGGDIREMFTKHESQKKISEMYRTAMNAASHESIKRRAAK